MSIASCAANWARPICSSSRSSRSRASRRPRRTPGIRRACRWSAVPKHNPDHPDSVVHRLVGRSRRVRLFPHQGLGRVARPRLRQGAGQLLRDAGRPAHGDAVAELHPRRILRQGRRHRARRQRLRLRPLRLSRVSAGQRQGALARRHGVLADAGEVRLREVRDAAGLLQAVRIPARLLGRVSEEPAAAHAGRRAGLNYLCPGLKRFFAHAVPTAEKLAAQLRAAPASRPRM